MLLFCLLNTILTKKIKGILKAIKNFLLFKKQVKCEKNMRFNILSHLLLIILFI